MNYYPTIKRMIDFFLSLLALIFLSPLYDAFAEFGSTMLTLAYSITIFPTYGEPTYGLNYFFRLSNALPNVLGILDEVKHSFIYTELFQSYFPVKMALGGSYLGELYYNFSYLGVFAAGLLGLMIGTVSRKTYPCDSGKKLGPLIDLIGVVSEPTMVCPGLLFFDSKPIYLDKYIDCLD